MTERKDETSPPRGAAPDEPLGNALDLREWEPQLPPSGFAERVLARVLAEGADPAPGAAPAQARAPRMRSRRWAAIGGGAAALTLAAAILLRITAPPAHGEAVAQRRIEVAIGARALAVLEPGATVRWDGDDVVQSRGDVFYRVEPGARFTVHTPAGDVEVKGTCFAVKVRPVGGADRDREEPDMVRRDVKAGAVGAAFSALAIVAVYEGKVAVSHASDTVELRAGETAQTGPGGVKRTGGTAEGEKGFDVSVESAGDDPVGKANEDLVRQVSEYRARLEAIVAQKTELEAKLKKSEETLAASRDGAALPRRHEFDLGQDDWRELAKEGTIKYQMPCLSKRGDPWTPSPEKLNALGLAPQDAPMLKNAYAHSNERVWTALKPLCAQAIGSADVAEKIGPSTCIHLILEIETERNNEAASEARRQVGEIRAGIRPMPGPNEPMNPVLKMFLAMTGESKSFEAELAQSFGPDEAHRIVFSDELCMATSTFGGDRPKK